MNANMRRTATIDYRVSRVPILCKDCRQDVGFFPARHVCNSSEAVPPLPIFDLKTVAMNSHTQQQQSNNTTSTAGDKVGHAKVAVGKGWEVVRNMNWKDMTRKDTESNGSRMWGKLLEATSTARQRVADKYYTVREGGNESDDDTPDNTHTQRVLAQYYLTTEGTLPQWLPPPPSLATQVNPGASHRPSPSNASSASSGSMYRAGSKPVSLQDIYDSAGPHQPPPSQSKLGRNQDLYANDQTSSSRPSLGGDRLRTKLRPTNSRPTAQPTASRGSDNSAKGSGYSGRSGFGGGDDYDPYNYQQQGGQDSGRSRQGQYGGEPPRQGGRRGY